MELRNDKTGVNRTTGSGYSCFGATLWRPRTPELAPPPSLDTGLQRTKCAFAIELFRLGCSDTSDSGHHLEAVIIEDSDAEMEQDEPLPSLDSPGDGVTVGTCALL